MKRKFLNSEKHVFIPVDLNDLVEREIYPFWVLTFKRISDSVENSNLPEKIQKQVERTRTEEQSPKNTTLYFSLLLETKDLLNATMNLLEEYYGAHDRSVKPATLKTPEDEE